MANTLNRQILNNFTQSGEAIIPISVNNNLIGNIKGFITMTKSINNASQVVNRTKIKSQQASNKQHLGTLKLWQRHIEALSKPRTEPMETSNSEKLDAFLDIQIDTLKSNRNIR